LKLGRIVSCPSKSKLILHTASTNRKPRNHLDAGCPILGAFLFLRLGWAATTLSRPHSINPPSP